MKKNYFKSASPFSLAALALCCAFGAMKAQPVTVTYTYTGSMQSFTVPSCVGTITITVAGAQGIGYNGYVPGTGGWARGTLSVTPGDVLNVFVGGSASGYNGGGAGLQGAIGGGGSDVRRNGIAFADRVIVAGGGGGAGGDNWQCLVGPGDGGGGTAVGANFVGGGGGAGYTSGSGCGTNGGNTGGTGGSGTHGGGGGGGGFTSGGGGATSTLPGTAGTGSLGLGGACFAAPLCQSGTGTGGGGGGYYGGGGAAGNNCGAGRGGGGSSWTSTLTSPSFTAGTRTGNGIVTLVYNFNGNGVVTSLTPTALCNGSTATLTASGMLSYTWTNGPQAATYTVNPNTTTSYTVSGTNSVGCVSSSILTVTVSPGLPVLSVTSSTNQTCLGKTVTLTASGALSYSWTGGVTNGVSYAPTVTSGYTVTGVNGCGAATAATTVIVSPLPVTAISSPTIICAGSPATLTAISGATGYTWQPFSLSGATVAVSPTVTTIYTVSVSDGTCSGITNVTLTAKPIPTIGVVASTSAVCAGNPVFMTASGGINYTWTPGNLSGPSVTVNPSGPTLYSVIGDNSVSCTSSTTQIVLTTASPTVNVSASSTFVCSGDAVNLTASGSASSYTWINGPQTAVNAVNPVSSGIYTVMGANSSTGCSTTKTIAVTVFIFPVSINTPTTTICSGTSLTLTASGADEYAWVNGPPSPENSITPSVTTSYTVTGNTTSLGITCYYTGTVQITVNPNPTVVATGDRTVICKGESTTLNATGAPNFSWSTGALTAAATVSSNIINIFTYSVTGTNANGCKGLTTIQVKVNGCTGIEQLYGIGSQLSVYPNPANGEFMIESVSTNSGAEITLSLVNELGQQVRNIVLNKNNNYKATVSGLACGLYIVTGQDEKHLLNQKIMVQQ